MDHFGVPIQNAEIILTEVTLFSFECQFDKQPLKSSRTIYANDIDDIINPNSFVEYY